MPKILLVEDNELNRDMLRRRLERSGFTICCAPDGPAGPMSRMGLIGPDGQLRPEVFDTSGGGPGPEFERRLDDLVKLLGPRPFFFADQPSRADLAVFGSLFTMYHDIYPGGRALLDRRPALIAHFERVLAAAGGRAAGDGLK